MPSSSTSNNSTTAGSTNSRFKKQPELDPSLARHLSSQEPIQLHSFLVMYRDNSGKLHIISLFFPLFDKETKSNKDVYLQGSVLQWKRENFTLEEESGQELTNEQQREEKVNSIMKSFPKTVCVKLSNFYFDYERNSIILESRQPLGRSIFFEIKPDLVKAEASEYKDRMTKDLDKVKYCMRLYKCMEALVQQGLDTEQNIEKQKEWEHELSKATSQEEVAALRKKIEAFLRNIADETLTFEKVTQKFDQDNGDQQDGKHSEMRLFDYTARLLKSHSIEVALPSSFHGKHDLGDATGPAAETLSQSISIRCQQTPYFKHMLSLLKKSKKPKTVKENPALPNSTILQQFNQCSNCSQFAVSFLSCSTESCTYQVCELCTPDNQWKAFQSKGFKCSICST